MLISSPLWAGSSGNVFITNQVTCITVLHIRTHMLMMQDGCVFLSFWTCFFFIKKRTILLCDWLCLFLCVCISVEVCMFCIPHLVSVFLHGVLLDLFDSVSDVCAILQNI